MINRKEKQIKSFIKTIDGSWKLNLRESNFLNSVLNLIIERNSDGAEDFLEKYLDEDWGGILYNIPDSDIQSYAEYDLDMVEENDCKETTLADFDDHEILGEALDRELTLHIPSQNDIISESQFSELADIFEKLDFGEREKLLNNLR